jgi:hypothetical protein
MNRRERPGGPHSIADDPARDRLWVASSGRNEVVGPGTGRLFLAGVTMGVVQVIDPGTGTPAAGRP